jgi:ureidoglycolate hydrolase
MNLNIKTITKDNFSLYGDLITIRDKSSEGINNNTTQSFFDLANIKILGEDKNARLNIFSAKKKNFSSTYRYVRNASIKFSSFFTNE